MLYLITHTFRHRGVKMSIFNIISSFFGETAREAELKSFAKSEYKNDWEYAYNNLKGGRWPESRKQWLDVR